MKGKNPICIHTKAASCVLLLLFVEIVTMNMGCFEMISVICISSQLAWAVSADVTLWQREMLPPKLKSGLIYLRRSRALITKVIRTQTHETLINVSNANRNQGSYVSVVSDSKSTSDRLH